MNAWVSQAGKSSNNAAPKIKYLLEGIVKVSELGEKLKQESNIVNENLVTLNTAVHLVSYIQKSKSKGKFSKRSPSIPSSAEVTITPYLFSRRAQLRLRM